MMPEAAMVLAAGLGKRMRPLTATRPKPLIEVAGATLLDHALARLAIARVPRAVVNVHYMADQVEAHVARRPAGLEIRISNERPQLLETGGGVARALPLLDADPFFVLNSDNFWIDGVAPTLAGLAAKWEPTRMDALLLLVPLARAHGYEGSGDFHMDESGRLRRRAECRVAPYVFSGVQILARSLFDGVAVEPFSLNRLYDQALAQGRLYGALHSGLWFHVGTPEAIAETEAVLAHA
jgi:MurNAc alpha-1-phosphate uridylyltransferase